MNIPKLAVGDILELKKNHPCGNDRVKILRLGSDVLVACTGCGHCMTLGRIKLERALRRVVAHGDANSQKGETL